MERIVQCSIIIYMLEAIIFYFELKNKPIIINKKIETSEIKYDFIIEVAIIDNENKEIYKEMYIAQNTRCLDVNDFIKTKRYKKLKKRECKEQKCLKHNIKSYKIERRKHREDGFMECGFSRDLFGNKQWELVDITTGQIYIKI